MSDDLLKRLSEKPFERWALDRIEALEAALREIDRFEVHRKDVAAARMQRIARAALDKDK